MIPIAECSTSGTSSFSDVKEENPVKLETRVTVDEFSEDSVLKKGNIHSGKKSSIEASNGEISEDQINVSSDAKDTETVVKSKSRQMSITDAFSKMSEKKRKNGDTIASDITKKAKLEHTDSNHSEANAVSKINKSKSKVIPNRCKNCHQLLDDPDLKLFPGDPEDAVEEYIALTDPKLSVYNEDDANDNDVCERLQHKITNFCVYDQNTHLCAFDSGLIEKNIELYFSGVVKPIYDDDPSIEGGIPTKNLGPINEWWVSGFDGGEHALVGFSTAFAEYILMNPNEMYTPFMDAIREKIHLSKTVIEFLCENEEATYEDLLNKLETSVPPQGISAFTEDSLLRHSQFLVDQIQSFDNAAEDTDSLLIVTSCVRSLISLAGVTLGKRRAMRRAERGQAVAVKKSSFSLAATTPLVKDIFESFFTDQLAKDLTKTTAPRRKRCGVCEPCQLPDCGKCSFCRDMVKFGGSGRSKQACSLRRCPNMAVQEANEDDILDDDDGDNMDKKALSSTTTSIKHHAKKQKSKIEWLGDPIKATTSKKFYNQVSINDEVYKPGDCVLVVPNDTTIPMYVAKIIHLWEDSKQIFEETKRFHAMWFCRGSDTVLGETSDPLELFGLFECEDSSITCIHSKCTVVMKDTPKNWAILGGTEESLHINMIEDDDGKTFFCQKWYNADNARIEDPPRFIKPSKDTDLYTCLSCEKRKDTEETTSPKLGDVLEKNDTSVSFKSVSYMSRTYIPGECIYLDPEIYEFPNMNPKDEKKIAKKKIDEEMYPEAYRKSDYVKGSNENVPEPFKIGLIKKIFKKPVNAQKIKLLVSLFYRPENTHQNISLTYTKDLNMLYWSDEEITVEVSDIQGKCYVLYHEDLISSPEEFCQKGPHRFYFNEAYISSTKEFELPPRAAYSLANKSVNKRWRGKSKSAAASNIDESSNLAKEEELYPSVESKLSSLDIFAGCGGLSEGFHQSGVAESVWAIEKEEPAAQAFRLNFPKCTVFAEDCNLLLRLVMDQNETHYKGQRLPQKRDVELICGGPPCQGFSGMNSFNFRQSFKNSLIVSFLSYCDCYRPRFFVLENVRNSVSFKHYAQTYIGSTYAPNTSMCFGVLQAGNYGVPQTRRAIIMAAAPGEKLRFYPEPTRVQPKIMSAICYGG